MLFRSDCQAMPPSIAALIPTWIDRSADLTGPVASLSCVMGRSLGGAVTALDGQVEAKIESDDPMGSRAIFFHLNRGEPGDSGTLLYSVDDCDSPKVLGVFRGFQQSDSNNSKQHSRRAVAATIPPHDKLTWLPVCSESITQATIFFWRKNVAMVTNQASYQCNFATGIVEPIPGGVQLHVNDLVFAVGVLVGIFVYSEQKVELQWAIRN